MTTTVLEVDVPFSQFYDPNHRDTEWEEAGLATLTDGSDATYLSFDPLLDDHTALWFIINADDFPTGSVVSMTFTMRARTTRLDDPDEYITYNYYLIPLDGASGYMRYGDSSAGRGLGVPYHTNPDTWSEEGAYLNADAMGEALGVDPGPDWFAAGASWNSVPGFANFLRNHDGARVQVQSTLLTGAWDFAQASMVFGVEVATASGSASSTPSRVHFSG